LTLLTEEKPHMIKPIFGDDRAASLTKHIPGIDLSDGWPGGTLS